MPQAEALGTVAVAAMQFWKAERGQIRSGWFTTATSMSVQPSGELLWRLKDSQTARSLPGVCLSEEVLSCSKGLCSHTKRVSSAARGKSTAVAKVLDQHISDSAAQLNVQVAHWVFL